MDRNIGGTAAPDEGFNVPLGLKDHRVPVCVSAGGRAITCGQQQLH